MSDKPLTKEEQEKENADFQAAIKVLNGVGKAPKPLPYVEQPTEPLNMSVAALGMLHVGFISSGSHMNLVEQLSELLSISSESVVNRLKRLNDRPELINALSKVRPTGRQGVILLAGMLISA
jgi:hypothetical protein